MKLDRSKMNQDRRIKARHAASSLELTLHRTGLRRLLKKPIQVTCIDFNRYGVSIEANSHFRLNERVNIDFRGKYISQSNVGGFISSRVKNNSVWRIGITFSNFTCNKEYSRQIDNALARIESLYNQHYKTTR